MTTISLDMQLYITAIQLKSKDNVNRNFIYRIGERPTVFAFLNAMGFYIDGSGLDQSIVEAEASGLVTFGRIKEGKEMQRGLASHTALYLTLYK